MCVMLPSLKSQEEIERVYFPINRPFNLLSHCRIYMAYFMVKLKCHITSIFFTVKSYRNAYLLSEELGLRFVSSAAEGHHNDQKAGEANK